MKDKVKTIFQFFFSVFIAVSIGCNLYLAYRAYTVTEKNSLVVVTNVVDLVSSYTNSPSFIPSSSSPSDPLSCSPPLSGSSPFKPSESSEPKMAGEFPYQYFIAHRRIGAYIYGRPFYEGSLTAYGRIKYIFPDRIILENNDYLSNRFQATQTMESRHD